MNTVTKCEGCDCLMKTIAPCKEFLYNWKCTHPDLPKMGIPTGRPVAYRVPFRADIQAPVWCPLKGNDTSAYQPPTTTPKRRKLDDLDVEKILNKLPDNLKFDDINEGDILHIPPLHGFKRSTVKVTKKYIQSLTCVDIEVDYVSYVHLYADGMRFKFASRIKEANNAKRQ